MGHYSFDRKSIFDSLIEADDFDDVEKFDFIKSVIVNTDLLENDCAGFMDSELSFIVPTPVYELCHEELLTIIWMAKYAKSCFLPEVWICYVREYDGKCFKCVGRARLHNSCSCIYCVAEIGQFYRHDDIDKFAELVNNDKNYCSSCRMALYEIEDVYHFDYSRTGICDYFK
uniref:Uncharacterized protein n=1 Tax=Trichoplusia ni single nucleopolyhedrovirus TaxID=332054 RepID=A0A481V8Q0_9ABAC|nr:hypothetical protein [Trichoplusia ni single nucleopolyhedrovirus]